MKKLLLFAFLLLIYTLNIYPQVNQEWYRTYHTSGDDFGSLVLTDSKGNVYVAGTTSGNLIIIKYKPNGDQLWTRTLYDNFYIDAFGIDKNDNLYVACRRYDNAELVKYDSSGVLQWTRPQIAYYFSEFHSLAIDKENNIIVTGECNDLGVTYTDYITIKYNPNGDSLWCKKYNGPSNGIDRAYSVAVDDSLNIYVTGSSWGYIATIKYDLLGNEKWVSRYSYIGRYGDSYGSSICLDSKKNIAVTGFTLGKDNYYDYLTLKLRNDGIFLWSKTYNYSNNPQRDNRAEVVLSDKNDNIIISGTSTGDSTSFDYCTIKYDSSGNQLWVRRYDGPTHGIDRMSDLKMDSTGNIYVTGYIINSFPNGVEIFYFCTIKYGINGDMLWKQIFQFDSDSNSYMASSLTLDKWGNVYVTGTGKIRYQNFNFDIFTVKYTQNPINVSNNKEIINNYKLFQNYPNPFNPTTTIKYELPKSSNVKIIVYDILGKEIATLVNQYQKPGIYEIQFPGNNGVTNNQITSNQIPSGIYFYSLFSDGIKIDTKKFVILK